MKIIIFGGAGFLGSHTADELTNRGYEVTIFDRLPSPYLKDGQEMIVGDILDEECVSKAIEGHQVVYNFAAIANIDVAATKPSDTAKINIIGTLNILEACKEHNVKRFVFSSSVYVYSDRGSFYRCSKQSCELFIENYQKEFGLDYTILRYGSLYGPRADSYNSIVRMSKQALEKKKIVWEGDGEEIREYIHVLDAAKTGADILDKEYKNSSYILTGSEQMKIKDLLTMIKEMLKGDVEIEYAPTDKNMHYEITPYVFKPCLARKIKAKEHIDMGQGILEILDNVYGETQAKSTGER